jgi:hypothetical protein
MATGCWNLLLFSEACVWNWSLSSDILPPHIFWCRNVRKINPEGVHDTDRSWHIGVHIYLNYKYVLEQKGVRNKVRRLCACVCVLPCIGSVPWKPASRLYPFPDELKQAKGVRNKLKQTKGNRDPEPTKRIRCKNHGAAQTADKHGRRRTVPLVVSAPPGKEEIQRRRQNRRRPAAPELDLLAVKSRLCGRSKKRRQS